MSRHLKWDHSIIWRKKTNPQITSFVSAVPSKIDKSTTDSITRSIAYSLAETSAPYRLVDNKSFKEALSLLNANYTLPSHQTISRKIGDIFEE